MFTFPTIFVVLEFNIIMANSLTAIYVHLYLLNMRKSTYSLRLIS